MESHARGMKLGRHLMKVLELCAFQCRMPQVTLTVFKENKDAQKFFRSLNYGTDETDPSFHDVMGTYGYDILSKRLPVKGNTV